MKDTIPIKRQFSILNEAYAQIIIEMSNGEFWSISIDGTTFNAFRVDYSKTDNEVLKIDWDSELTRGSLSDIRTAIWKTVNNIND